MHLPDSMLQGKICPVTAAISSLCIAGAVYACWRSRKSPSASRFGAVTAFIFAAQMINFPISSGTSGHLLGGVLAASLLGVPFGMIAMALVVTVQSLFFSDGGLMVLGANVLNMAVIGAGIGGGIRVLIEKHGRSRSVSIFATGMAAWISVLIAATAVSVELALAGAKPFAVVFPAMIGTHFLIGAGEALITALAYALLQERAPVESRKRAVLPLCAAGLIALILSPFASSLPDGLEFIAQRYSFLHESMPLFSSPLPDYAIPLITNSYLSTGLAGLLGVMLTFSLASLLAVAMQRDV